MGGDTPTARAGFAAHVTASTQVPLPACGLFRPDERDSLRKVQTSPSSLSTTKPTDSAGPTGDDAISSDHAQVITGDEPQLGHEDHDIGAARSPLFGRTEV